MFENIFNLRLQRTPGQAVVFYIVFIVVGLLLSVVASSIFASDFDEGVIVGSILALIYCPVVALLVLNAKGLNKPGLIMLALSSTVLSLAGVFVGLIVAAYLTTLESQN